MTAHNSRLRLGKNPKRQVCFLGDLKGVKADKVVGREKQKGERKVRWTIKETLCNAGKLLKLFWRKMINSLVIDFIYSVDLIRSDLVDCTGIINHQLSKHFDYFATQASRLQTTQDELREKTLKTFLPWNNQTCAHFAQSKKLIERMKVLGPSIHLKSGFKVCAWLKTNRAENHTTTITK